MIAGQGFDGRWRWLALAVGIALADQSAKRWIAAEFPLGASQALTPFFNLAHLLNEGAAFSLLAGAGGWQRYFFIALALAVATGLVLALMRRALTRWEAWAYSLLLGGTLGNLVDRVVRGSVVDYLDFHAGGWHWPAFNLADSVIVLSVLLLVGGVARSTGRGQGTGNGN